MTLNFRVDRFVVRNGGLGARGTATARLSGPGWATRTVEAMLRPGVLPYRYPWIAYRTWQTLFAFDDAVARRLVPRQLFYNCILSATTPRLAVVRDIA